MAVVFESQPPFYSTLKGCKKKLDKGDSISYLCRRSLIHKPIQSIMLQDMNTRQLAEAIQEDLSKVELIINFSRGRDVAQLMAASCASLEGKHSCNTPLYTLLSNIDEASDLIIEKTYK